MNLQGKKTYLFVAGTLVSLVTGVAARRGVDFGLDVNDMTEITTTIASFLAIGAAWARSKADMPRVDEQSVITPRPGQKK